MTIINRSGGFYAMPQAAFGTHVPPVQNTNKALPILSDTAPLKLATAGSGVVPNQFSARGGQLVGHRQGQRMDWSAMFKLPVYDDATVSKADLPEFSTLFAMTPCTFTDAGSNTLTLTPAAVCTPGLSASNTASPVVASLTFFQSGGDVKYAVDCVGIIAKIAAKADEPVLVEMTGHGQCLSTAADSIVDLSTTFTADAVETSDADFFMFRNATVTIAGPGGSGELATTGFEFTPGQTINPQMRAESAEGYGIATVFHGAGTQMKISVKGVAESERAFYAALFAETATTVTLQFKNVAGTFKFTITLAAGRITAIEETTDNDQVNYDLTIDAGSVDDTPAYTLAWGKVS